MALPTYLITETDIRRLASSQSYDRGEEYYRGGAVGGLVRRGSTVTASVEGHSYPSYEVTIELSESGIASVACTCPYDWGGACKHIVAVLLACVHDPDEIEERPTITALLTGLDAETLRGLLADLLARAPELTEWIELQLAGAGLQTASPDGPQPQPTPVNAGAIRRQVRAEMRAPYDYHATSGVVRGLDGILQEARRFLEAGDGESALVIAEIIAEETIPGWEEHDDSDGEFGDWFSALGTVFAEALLTATLSPSQRQDWAHKIEQWQAELDDYGVDEALDAALGAAVQGWDYEPLRRALAGHPGVDGAWTGEAPWFAAELTEARLNVLERQGRVEEFLRLADAESAHGRYLTMLVKAGRPQEAVDYALRRPIAPGEALALARALQARGEEFAALRVGKRGLALGGYGQLELARWLRDAAAALGEDALALRAARVAFEAGTDFVDYQTARALAGAGWPAVREELLAYLAAYPNARERIDIYLAEGMVDEAIRAVDEGSYAAHGQAAKVAAVACQSHPDWVIRLCRAQAEPIMDGGQSRYYSSAIGWLQIAARAYLAAGRAAEWRTYCEGLIAAHKRKSSLAPQLRALLEGVVR